MADSKNKNYGGITQAADAKKQQGKMPPNANFSETVDAMQGHVRQQVKETGKSVETSESVLNIQKSFTDALRSMTQTVGKSAVTQNQQKQLLSKIASQNKTKGGGGLNPAEMAKILAAVTAKQAKQAKIPTLQKGGSVSKTGLAKIHAGESVFPKGSLEELVSLMKEQVYHIKQISGFYDDVKIPDMLKLDDKSFGEQFKDWIAGGLKNAFPTFYKIGKAIGKPFYKLFRVRGGTYVYATHLSKAESPFRQISENIGVLYTGSMLHMDRMINIQKAIAEAVRDLATYTIPGKSYTAIEDIKPSKKWRAITAIAKGVGKGILGLGGAALGGMVGMTMGGPLGAIAGAASGGMLGYKKGGTMLKGAGKVVGRSIMGKDVVTDEEFERFRKWKEEKKEGLKFWKKKPAKEEDLLGATFPKDISKKTMKEPIGVKFAKIKSKFSKKNKENVIDTALTPEAQKALDQSRDSLKQLAENSTATLKESKGGGIGGFISMVLPFLPLALGFIKGFPGMAMGWMMNALESVGGWVLKKGAGIGWDVLSFLGRNVFKFILGSALGKLLLAFSAGYGIGTLINKYLITPWLDEQDKRTQKDRQDATAKLQAVKANLPKTSAVDTNNLTAQGLMTPEILKNIQLQQYKDTFGDMGNVDVQKIMQNQMGENQFDVIRSIMDFENASALEHVNEYSMYDPDQVQTLRLKWLKEVNIDPYDAEYQSPKGYAQLREEAFREYMKTKLKPLGEGKLTKRQKKQVDYAKLQAEKNQSPIPTSVDATENIIKIAKENATKTLTDTYGLSAGEAKRYVEMAAKDLQNDAHSLTDSSILTKTAAAYMQKETGRPPGDKSPAGAPSDYGKTSAINEANQAAMTTDAVKQGVAEGMKPGLAEQAKAISSAVNLSASSGVSNQISNNSTTSTNANTNYNLPGQKDPWAQQAQLGNIPR